MKKVVLLVVVLAGLLLTAVLGKGRKYDVPKSDEVVVCFDGAGWFDAKDGCWVVPVAGRIFEPELDSLWRRGLKKAIAEAVGVDEDTLAETLLDERLTDFVGDNEGGKELAVRIAGETYVLEETEGDGRFEGEFRIKEEKLKDAVVKGELRYDVLMKEGDERRFSGVVQLLASGREIVISDVDDTVKVSGVGDKKELMKNVFLREYAATDGMVEHYQAMAKEGAAFFYVSASPEQLYRPLASFLKEAGCPRGSLSLRSFYMKDTRVLNMLEESGESKRPVVEGIVKRYAECHFVLIGDAGEQDAAMYGAVARMWPERVKRIEIRTLGEVTEEEILRLKGMAGELPVGCEFKVYHKP